MRLALRAAMLVGLCGFVSACSQAAPTYQYLKRITGMQFDIIESVKFEDAGSGLYRKSVVWSASEYFSFDGSRWTSPEFPTERQAIDAYLDHEKQ